LSLMAPAQAARILAKQDPRVVQAGDDATLLDIRIHKGKA
jgi:hypothetical protein